MEYEESVQRYNFNRQMKEFGQPVKIEKYSSGDDKDNNTLMMTEEELVLNGFASYKGTDRPEVIALHEKAGDGELPEDHVTGDEFEPFEPLTDVEIEPIEIEEEDSEEYEGDEII